MEIEGQRKTIIYLDQFVISHIVKALDPEFPRREALDTFWLDLFRKLDRLLKLQLIVCPDSVFHLHESLLSGDPSFQNHQDIYTHLSNDCTFQDDMSILRWQVHSHFRNYLEGHSERDPDLDSEEVVNGNLNEWQDSIAVTVPHQFNPTEVAALRHQKAKQNERIKEAFEKWKDDATPIKKAIEEEALHFGRSILLTFWEGFGKQLENMLNGRMPLSLEELLPSSGARLVYDLFRMLQEEYGIDTPSEQLKKVTEYFQSPDIIRIPFVRLSAMLYASIARKTQAGRRTPPNVGTSTDVTAIASLLPYCDAMFLDKEMASYLQDMPLRAEVKKFDTRIFSLNTKTDFLAFLEALEAAAGKWWVTLVEGHYGKGWLEPYVDILTNRKDRRRREQGEK